MAVNVEMWRPDIIEGLYKSNAFMRRAYDADEYVVGGSIVHIPQSGGGAGVERNRSVLPAAIVQRADTDIVYPLDEYTSNPTHIPHAETMELSYDKRQSVIRENTAEMMEFVGDDLLYKWSANIPAANKVVTTGSTAAATAPGATGTRKILTEADILKAKFLLDQQNVPRDGRVLILPAAMIYQILQDSNLKYAFQQVINLPEGVMARLHGFDVIERSRVIIQGDGGTSGAPKLPEAASATTDDEAGLFYQQDMVERALGTVEMFDDQRKPEYYGDIVSFLIRMGGRNRREDNKGVGLIVASD